MTASRLSLLPMPMGQHSVPVYLLGFHGTYYCDGISMAPLSEFRRPVVTVDGTCTCHSLFIIVVLSDKVNRIDLRHGLHYEWRRWSEIECFRQADEKRKLSLFDRQPRG